MTTDSPRTRNDGRILHWLPPGRPRRTYQAPTRGLPDATSRSAAKADAAQACAGAARRGCGCADADAPTCRANAGEGRGAHLHESARGRFATSAAAVPPDVPDGALLAASGGC